MLVYKLEILNYILMEEKRARVLLKQVRGAYNSGMIRGLQKFVSEYKGPEEDKQYLERVFKYITERNQRAPNSRLFGIDSLLVEVILEETGIGSEKGRKWLDTLARNSAILNSTPQTA
jgi:hypothetical protein